MIQKSGVAERGGDAASEAVGLERSGAFDDEPAISPGGIRE